MPPHHDLVIRELVVRRIGPESDLLLRNLFEHYCHDMSEWFDLDTQSDGSYSYDTASIWAKGYTAYLATVGQAIAGFALIDPTDVHDVREFFVLRKFRRRGIARQMAFQLWNERPGGWLVRVLEANQPAMAFWRAAISSYTAASFREESCAVKGRVWRYFYFSSPGR